MHRRENGLRFAAIKDSGGSMLEIPTDDKIQQTQNGPAASDLAQVKQQTPPKTAENSPSPGDEQAP
jgi:hypothetical protein